MFEDFETINILGLDFILYVLHLLTGTESTLTTYKLLQKSREVQDSCCRKFHVVNGPTPKTSFREVQNLEMNAAVNPRSFKQDIALGIAISGNFATYWNNVSPLSARYTKISFRQWFPTIKINEYIV